MVSGLGYVLCSPAANDVCTLLRTKTFTVVLFMQLCKIDQEGEARKVVGCSSVVVTVSYAVLQLNCAVMFVGWMDLKLAVLQDYGEETEGHSVLQEYLKNKN